MFRNNINLLDTPGANRSLRIFTTAESPDFSIFSNFSPVKTTEIELEMSCMQSEVQKQVRGIAGNDKCIDCDAAHPQWASVSYGTLMCLECSGQHRGLGVHLSFVRSMQMDSWSEREISCMLNGGNKKLLTFFKKYNIAQRSRIVDKYNSPAAELYRGIIEAMVDGKPVPTELPKRIVPKVPPPQTDYAPEEEATHPGESFADRYNRMTRESNERMHSKYGNGKMQGIGSCPPPEVDNQPNQLGLDGAVSSVMSFVKSAAAKTTQIINDPALKDNIKGGIDSLKNTEVVKNTLGWVSSAWGKIQQEIVKGQTTSEYNTPHTPNGTAIDEEDAPPPQEEWNTPVQQPKPRVKTMDQNQWDDWLDGDEAEEVVVPAPSPVVKPDIPQIPTQSQSETQKIPSPEEEEEEEKLENIPPPVVKPDEDIWESWLNTDEPQVETKKKSKAPVMILTQPTTDTSPKFNTDDFFDSYGA